MFETFSWDIWLGIGSGALLVVGLLLAAAHRTRDADDSGYGATRRQPMPLYEEGGAS